jgi:rubrerythrin
MKYLVLSFMLIVSLSAFTANQKDKSSIKERASSMMKDAPTQLDDLMRGEMAALKAYDQALADLKDEKERSKLMAIRDDHEKALSAMSKYVEGKPELLKDTEEAGPWGTFAKSWTKGRGLVGNEGAIKALRQGEQHGINEYEEALRDEKISKELKDRIRSEFLPNQKKHVESLKKLI